MMYVVGCEMRDARCAEVSGKGVLLDEGIGSGGGHTLRLAATCRSSFKSFFFFSQPTLSSVEAETSWPLSTSCLHYYPEANT
jgi:hypothetical protein